MSVETLDARVRKLQAQGVRVSDPRQTYIGEDVDLSRVREGAVLHPGTRLEGARTFVAPGAQVGSEGPATVRDAVLGPDTVVAAGFVHGAVLLDGASVGSGAHVRPGTLLEEQASTAHCVGLKHTILLGFVTLGSLINFCDCLMAGGTSRRDHSEVGSGFIHFNYTPWGASGDKATPSLIGEVPRGVFLRERRIFLGGSSGLIGPGRVGFGAITGAGQVVRKPVGEGRLSLQPIRALDVERSANHLDRVMPRAKYNVRYIAHLVALRRWYREVRLCRASDDVARILVLAAIENLDACIAERVKRVRSFVEERGAAMPTLDLDPDVACPWGSLPGDGSLDHIAWVRSLEMEDVERGSAWLEQTVEAVERSAWP